MATPPNPGHIKESTKLGAVPNAGLYTQTVLAPVFQLMGVALVVEDVRSARRRLDRLTTRFREIDLETKLEIKRMDREVYDESGGVRGDVDFHDLFAAPFLMIQAVTSSLTDKANALADQQDEYHGRGWTTWIGPVSLLLGV
ncbi:hypothetical protein HZU40_17200 [Mycolicibacterium fluoranthenivorans]|uniref:Uncharacterized protein n=1 Tax=Mycolicibacterium fluoranthenivorans TaxID=258505 RepID=A0A7G8P6T2_9MYCO|nr:hypothetical protein [Mycolicibacterium fluoranthenivorans]QNJ90048.1 hypothetical protein HZU40_17200 [Mycolicibacterium fluoranthenivorans]